MSQLNLPHETNNKKVENRKKTKKVKTAMLRSIDKQSVESEESVLEKKKEGYGGKDLQKRNVLSLE